MFVPACISIAVIVKIRRWGNLRGFGIFRQWEQIRDEEEKMRIRGF